MMQEETVMPDLSEFIQLECCGHHFLHPEEFLVYSTYKQDYLKQNSVARSENNLTYNLHSVTSQNDRFCLTMKQAEELRRGIEYRLIEKPVVEVCS